jgi:hypothetical protein
MRCSHVITNIIFTFTDPLAVPGLDVNVLSWRIDAPQGRA